MDPVATGSSFFAMGGYGAYVWPSFGVALLVLAVLWLASWRGLRAREAELARLQESNPRRRKGTST